MTTPTKSWQGAKPTDHPPAARSPKWLPRIAILLIAGLLASLIASLAAPGQIALAVTAVTTKLYALGPLGWILFIAAEAFAALIGILPGALLGLAAGAVYGLIAGFLTSAIGILLGAVIAFGLSRSHARPAIAHLLGRSPKLAAIDTALAGQSWRMVALLRVSPVMPFSITSYALGLSAISPRDYVIGTLAALPALAGYVAIGALGGATMAGGGRIRTAILILGALATLALTIQITRLLARAIKTAG